MSAATQERGMRWRRKSTAPGCVLAGEAAWGGGGAREEAAGWVDARVARIAKGLATI